MVAGAVQLTYTILLTQNWVPFDWWKGSLNLVLLSPQVVGQL